MKILVIAGVILFVLLIIYLLRRNNAPKEGITDISAQEAAEMIRQNSSSKDFIILDVRTPGEFASGHLKKSVNLDFHSTSFSHSLDSLNKDKTYLVYCRSGNRSSHASSMMKQKNFTRIYNLKGGIMMWSHQGLPLE